MTATSIFNTSLGLSMAMGTTMRTDLVTWTDSAMVNIPRLTLNLRLTGMVLVRGLPTTSYKANPQLVATLLPVWSLNAGAVPEVNGSPIYCEEVDTCLAPRVVSLKFLVAIGSTTMLKGRATFRSEPVATLCKCTFPTTRTPPATATAAAITADATVTLEAPGARTTEYP
ncbi:hypothetical protein LTR56_018972 [Elasticomyces elasticus]|nr:hypothetical protein LTR56_018972 [Elasticomyces elasticus]KAK3635560.1 hypothetical protein LTR22_019128 [Elasticomyces elasticus]KAK4911737.1 hypothetical protein LTR49_019727 [Elasticomyces elasticus]KAK5769775.1 hypothetical protein LTS12_000225 [Elasticomyces elasticus]